MFRDGVRAEVGSRTNEPCAVRPRISLTHGDRRSEHSDLPLAGSLANRSLPAVVGYRVGWLKSIETDRNLQWLKQTTLPPRLTVDLAGQALVTGALRGIGRATAIALAAVPAWPASLATPRS